jgi:hypothetical protein
MQPAASNSNNQQTAYGQLEARRANIPHWAIELFIN